MCTSGSMKLLAVAVFLGPCFTYVAAADHYRGIWLPTELGGFERGPIYDNEAQMPGLGITVAYSAPGVKATVFVYDLRNRSLPEGIDNAVVKEHSQQALADILSVHSNVSVLEPLAPATGSCSNFLRVKLSYVERGGGSGEVIHSYLYLGTRRGSFVKLRLSYPVSLAFKTGVVSEARFAQALCRSVAR